MPILEFNDSAGGKKRLRELLQGRSCLLVLDDLWQGPSLRAFDVLGDPGQLLITTHDSSLVTGIGAQEHSLDVLSVEQAQELLIRWSGCSESLATEAKEIINKIARECGYLPLALAMAGAMLKQSSRWERVLQRLQRADLDKIRQQFPDYAYPDLLKTLQVSVDALQPDLKERYLELAIFLEDIRIPEQTLVTFWALAGLDELDVDDIITSLVRKSLLRRDEDDRLYLHDLQYDYIYKQMESDLPALHERWLEAYRQTCADGWAAGPDDGYFFGHLALVD